MPIERCPMLSFAMGIAVVERARAAGVDASLKWPNDVVVADDTAPFGYRKLAGILAESHVGERQRFVVVGIGINLVRPAEIDPALGPDAVPTWLEDHAPMPARESFTAEVLVAFDRAVAVLTDEPAGFVDRYRSVCSTIGRVVEADLGGRRVVGTAVDVDPSGHLLLDVASAAGTERRVLSAGDVVHLRPSV